MGEVPDPSGNYPFVFNMFLEVGGAPERIRTSDPQIRSLVLYPAELRVRDWLDAKGTGSARAPVRNGV